MKRNFDMEVKDLDDEPLRIGMNPDTISAALAEFWPALTPEQGIKLQAVLDKHAKAPLTLKSACVAALIGAYEGEQNLDDTQRINRMELARRINKGGIQEITPADRDMIKPLVRKKFGGIVIPVTVGEMLEQDLPAGVA